jgi:hypothetical protein
MRRSIVRPCLVFAAFAAGTFSGASRAALDLAAPLQATAGAGVATVVLVPPMAVYRSSLDQAGLQTQGCHYTTGDPAAIRLLAAILKSADVTVNPVYQRPDIREGVYFTLADGSKFSVLIADNSGGKLPVMGIAETTVGGQIQSASVSSRSTLSTDVREWVKEHGGAGTGNGCDLQSAVAEDPKARRRCRSDRRERVRPRPDQRVANQSA